MKRFIYAIAVCLLLGGCCTQKEEKVENIILMIGDGMGLAHITALSISQDFEPLNMERAQYTGLQKTYSYNNRVTDSAAAATAIASGQKTYNNYIGVDTLGNRLESALELARDMGKATALIVTCPVTAATPAAFVAHQTVRRDHELIAEQYLGAGVDVVAGMGRQYFTDRKDGRDILSELEMQGYTSANSKDGFLAIGKAPAIMLQTGKNMVYMSVDSLGVRANYLPEATAKALELIEGTGKESFFMMVEGSLIDYAAHDNDIAAVIGEMRDFDNAVRVAYEYADTHPGTLVIVTGDHETGGLSIVSNATDFDLSESGLDYRFGTVSHSASYLPVFAYGPGAHNFTGVMENSEIGEKIKALLKDGEIK